MATSPSDRRHRGQREGGNYCIPVASFYLDLKYGKHTPLEYLPGVINNSRSCGLRCRMSHDHELKQHAVKRGNVLAVCTNTANFGGDNAAVPTGLWCGHLLGLSGAAHMQCTLIAGWRDVIAHCCSYVADNCGPASCQHCWARGLHDTPCIVRPHPWPLLPPPHPSRTPPPAGCLSWQSPTMLSRRQDLTSPSPRQKGALCRWTLPALHQMPSRPMRSAS